MKKAVVCGGGGFIGGHLVKRLKEEGFWVRAVDIKFHEYEETIVANATMLLNPPLSPELGQCILRPVSRADCSINNRISLS